MPSSIPVTPIAFPPKEYDPIYFNELIRILNLYFRLLQNPGPLVASTILVTDLPTSATGLPVGALWRDTTDNTIKIVPSTDAVVNVVGETASSAAGTITP